MKTPAELRQKLKRQWSNGELRQARLLEPHQWPLKLAIGKPGPAMVTNQISAVRQHIQQWRAITTGEVEWQSINYRSTAEAVQLPVNWLLNSPAEWLAATGDVALQQEFRLLSGVMAAVDPLFHATLIRQRQLLLSRSAEETIMACSVVEQLEPQCADGRPLRMLSIGGCDSKFFERNRTLLIRLLELRFGQQVTEQGLEQFLGALDEGEHWLLVAPLATELLPFRQLRIRSSELATTPLPGSHLLVVENERSLYQLPRLPGTIAILGAGLNLNWMQASWIGEKSVAYWGDLDSWGLTMLATARSYQPELVPLSMDEQTFDNFQQASAVVEPVHASPTPPEMLSDQEAALYLRLLDLERGRLEQEFVAEEWISKRLVEWHAGEP